MTHPIATWIAALAAIVTPFATAQTERDLAAATAAKTLVRVDAAEIGTWTSQGYRIVDLEITGYSPYQYTVSLVPNSGAFAVNGWWWWVGVTPVQMETALVQNNARLIDIETYNLGGQWLYAGVAVSNSGAGHKQSWNFYNATFQTIADHVAAQGTRIVDLDGSWANGTRSYCAVTVKNTGADQRAWWWYVGISAAQVAALPGQLNARTIDLEKDSTGFYDMVLVRNDGASWWQYLNLYLSEIEPKLRQNGARAVDIEAHYVNGVPRYDVVMVNRSNALSTQIGNLLRTLPVGETGCYLAQITPTQTHVRAALNETSVFEPASTLKTLPLVHAMRRVSYQAVSLGQTVTTSLGMSGTCPTGGAPTMNESMETALRLMMENSDNARTKTVVDWFGRSLVNATASALGMTSTSINHTFGCGGPVDNATTLEDLGRLHTHVIRGYVADQRQKLYELMINGLSYPSVGSLSFDSVMAAEAVALNLTSDEYQAFRNRVVYGCKGGNYDNPGASRYQGSYFGYLGLPRVEAGAVVIRDLVAGVYFNDASNKTMAFDVIGTAMVEMLRAEIRGALATWAGAEFGDLTFFGSSCAGTHGHPGLGTQGTPRIGQPLTYQVSNGPRNAPGVLYFGDSATQWNGLALPFDLGALQAPNCKLHVAPRVPVAIATSSAGGATVTFTLPATPSLVGGSFYAQFLLVDPPANALGVISTRGFAARVGLGL